MISTPATGRPALVTFHLANFATHAAITGLPIPDTWHSLEAVLFLVRFDQVLQLKK